MSCLDNFEFVDIDTILQTKITVKESTAFVDNKSEDDNYTESLSVKEEDIKEEDDVIVDIKIEPEESQNIYDWSPNNKKRKVMPDEASSPQLHEGVENPRNFLCEECDFITDKNWNLILHQKDVHMKISNTCGYCNKQVKHLKCHIEDMHENPRSYKCPFCDYRSNKSSGLKTHVRRMHDNSVVKHTCPICFKKCLDIEKHVTNVHEKPEPKDRNVKCDQCDFTATSRSNLWSHVGYAHKIVTWICPECNQEINKLNKSRHMRQHNAKPFSCTPCEKTFQNRRILANHILYGHKKHTNKCNYCQKDVTNLKFHVQAAHKEVDYSTIDISLDVRMFQNIKSILGATPVYNGELDNVPLEKIFKWNDLFDSDKKGVESETCEVNVDFVHEKVKPSIEPENHAHIVYVEEINEVPVDEMFKRNGFSESDKKNVDVDQKVVNPKVEPENLEG